MGKVIMSGRVPKLVAPVVLPAIGGALSDYTPEEIQIIAQAGQASNYWSVGDAVPITLNGTVEALTFSNETYHAFIIGFDHNSSAEGSNTIHFRFGKTNDGVDIAFVDGGYIYSGTAAGFRMNRTTNTNSGGWSSSYMRSTICPAFLSAMPSAWQNVIAACTKYSDNTGGGSDTASYVTATSDKIWLLAEYEVFGTRTNANSAEQNYQKQYDYYKAGNSKILYRHSITTSTCMWWLRSPSASSGAYFCRVNASGVANTANSNTSYAFAPGFMVA